MLCIFLNTSHIVWEIDKSDTEGKSLAVLINSKTKVMYSFEEEQFGFYQIVSFDWNLYKKLTKKE